MNVLQLHEGQAVLVLGNQGCTVISAVADMVDNASARISTGARTKLRVDADGRITVLPCPDIKVVDHVVILPFSDTTEGFEGHLSHGIIRRYFPIHREEERGLETALGEKPTGRETAHRDTDERLRQLAAQLAEVSKIHKDLLASRHALQKLMKGQISAISALLDRVQKLEKLGHNRTFRYEVCARDANLE
ncbi:hypothetical protein HD806DRAFT_533268 [Xylariaceae sp. AK1471]|nr:hypothetical protein HD806DRAFT_533268 [Xylariaceae sp. AK1471]